MASRLGDRASALSSGKKMAADCWKTMDHMCSTSLSCSELHVEPKFRPEPFQSALTISFHGLVLACCNFCAHFMMQSASFACVGAQVPTLQSGSLCFFAFVLSSHKGICGFQCCTAHSFCCHQFHLLKNLCPPSALNQTMWQGPFSKSMKRATSACSHFKF